MNTTQDNTRIEVPLFTINYVNKLYKNLDKENAIDLYNQPNFEIEDEYAVGGSGIYLKKDFYLDHDLDILNNAVKLYENLELNETYASDKRLWTYLTHVFFWDYMQKEWKIDFSKEKNQIIKFIRDRYFLNTLNIRSLTHNGISRLWWYTHLTIDESRKDKYELTKVLLSLQDIPVSLLERSLGGSSNIRKAVLEFLAENPGIKTSKKTQELLKQLNLVGGVKNLPMLKLNEVKSVLLKIKNNIS